MFILLILTSVFLATSYCADSSKTNDLKSKCISIWKVAQQKAAYPDFIASVTAHSESLKIRNSSMIEVIAKLNGEKNLFKKHLSLHYTVLSGNARLEIEAEDGNVTIDIKVDEQIETFSALIKKHPRSVKISCPVSDATKLKVDCKTATDDLSDLKHYAVDGGIVGDESECDDSEETAEDGKKENADNESKTSGRNDGRIDNEEMYEGSSFDDSDSDI